MKIQVEVPDDHVERGLTSNKTGKPYSLEHFTLQGPTDRFAQPQQLYLGEGDHPVLVPGRYWVETDDLLYIGRDGLAVRRLTPKHLHPITKPAERKAS